MQKLWSNQPEQLNTLQLTLQLPVLEHLSMIDIKATINQPSYYIFMNRRIK